jgi:hypothetical protein
MVSFWRGNAAPARPAVAKAGVAASKPAAARRPVEPDNSKAMHAPIQSWTGEDIRVQIQSANLASAYRAWRGATDRPLARLVDLTGTDARAAIDDMSMMLLKKDDGDFVVVAQSRNYIHLIERDLRGKLHSEMKTPTAEGINALMNWAIDNRAPVFARYVSGFSKQSLYWEVLILPLAADDSGKPAFTLNVVSLIGDKSAIMQEVFERSPVGMILAVPTASEKGGIDNGEILSINTRAREILRLTDSQRRIQTIRQLGPWFRDGTEWERTGVGSIENGRTRVSYRDGAGKNFEVTIELFSRYVLFSIVETARTEQVTLAPAE